MPSIAIARVSAARAARIAAACATLVVCAHAQAQEAPAPAVPAGEAQTAVQPQEPKETGAPASRHRKAGSATAKPEARKSAPAKSPETPSSSPAAANAVPAPAQQGAASPAPAAPVGEFEPVIHARNAKLGACMDNVVGQSARVIDRPHQAASTWVTGAPNDNVFSSIVSLSYPNKVTPNGAAVILAAPLGGGKCQGQSVQIYPTARSCTAVQASLIQIGKTIGTLENLPLLQLKDGSRNLLMPSAGGGCVVVTVQLRQ